MIYCIEDDPAIRNLMIYALKGAGLEARGFESAEVFWNAWEEVKPQMVMTLCYRERTACPYSAS